MPVKAMVRYMGLLALVCQATSSKVEQFPKFLRVSRGNNESMFCKFPILKETADVSWWREGEKTLMEPDNRKLFKVDKGRSTFTLLNVSLADAGIYYCRVKQQLQLIGNGTGSQLIVLTPPTPLKIVAIEGSAPHLPQLVCKTAAFYPEELKIIWQRNSVEILTGILTVRNTTADGFYEASSFLHDTQPAPGKTVYTCLVSHVSLAVPASFSYIFEQETTDKTLILGCVVGGLSFVVLLIILTRFALKAQRDLTRMIYEGINANYVEASHSVEPVRQASSEDASAYATLNLSEGKKITKYRRKEEHVVYAETKPGGDDKLTYASLQLSNSKETSLSKHNDKRSVYAGVMVSRKAIN